MRREALIASCLAASLSISAAIAITPGSVQAESQRPDIITIMVDDLGFLPRNSVLKRLPNIRETFLDGGLELRRMYGQTPVCSPGRANFLTGQNSLHNGVTENNSPPANPNKTVALALQRAGYHTTLIGKYFIDWDSSRNPKGWSDLSLFHDPGRLVSESVESLARAPKSQPVFAWLSATAPHRCNSARYPDDDCRRPYVPERFRDAPECRGIEPFKPPTYRTWKPPRPFPREMPYWPEGWDLVSICESMLQVDEMVGAITEAQEARGRPAYYLFFSDNGMAWGQKGFPGKRVPPSTRLPMYVSGPGIAGGSSSGKLLSIIDIAPTIASLGKADMPWVDGRSFMKLIKGEPFSGRKRALEHSFKAKARWSAVRYKNWRYIRWADGKKQLYHLTKDKWEQRNLVRKKPALASRLDRELKTMIERSRS